MTPTRIQKLITIAHEAHFRLELWLALSKQGFRHKTTSAWTDKRKEYWDEFLKLVVGNLVLPYYSIVYLYSILNLPCIMIGYINIE